MLRQQFWPGFATLCALVWIGLRYCETVVDGKERMTDQRILTVVAFVVLIVWWVWTTGAPR